MTEQPDHAKLLSEIRTLRDEVRPLIEIAPDLKAWGDAMRAASLWRKAVIGLAVLGASVGAIVGMLAGLKLAIARWLTGG